MRLLGIAYGVEGRFPDYRNLAQHGTTRHSVKSERLMSDVEPVHVPVHIRREKVEAIRKQRCLT